MTSGDGRPSEAAKCCFFFLPPSNHEPQAPTAALRLMTRLSHRNHTHHGNRLLAASPHRRARRGTAFLCVIPAHREARPATNQLRWQLCPRSGQSCCGIEATRGLASTAIPVRCVQPPVPLARNAYFDRNGGSDWLMGRSVAVHCTRTPSAAPRWPLAGPLSCMSNEWLWWFECARLVGA